MRDARGRQLTTKAKEELAKHIEDAIVKLRDLGLLRDSGRTRAKLTRTGVCTVAIPSQLPLQVPWVVLLHVAYSALTRRNDVARSFGLDPRTITKFRKLVAGVAMDGDTEFLRLQGDEFDREEQAAFVSSLSADATLHTFIFDFLGITGNASRSVCMSAWHILVSIQSFSWMGHDGGVKRCTTYRPTVPLSATENVDTLYDSLYVLKQIEHFGLFELKALRAFMKLFHFDIDGHGSNFGVVSRRKDAIYPLAVFGIARYAAIGIIPTLLQSFSTFGRS